MATPSGTQLFEIYDQVRVDIFGTNDSWTASAASGVPTSVMDIYAQKIASRINLFTTDGNVCLNFTTGTVTPNRHEIYALIEMGIAMLVYQTQTSILRRLASGLGVSTSIGDGVSVKNADGVEISTAGRYQERVRAFLKDGALLKEDFRDALNQYRYGFNGRNAARYIY